jgi:RNA polymerase sigma-32 factor
MGDKPSEPEVLGPIEADADDPAIKADPGMLIIDADMGDDDLVVPIVDDGTGPSVPLPRDKVKREIPRNAYSLVDIAGDSMVASDPLTTYLSQLRHITPLPAEDQQLLAEAYVEDEDVEAAKQLIMSNLRLVVKIAREYHRRTVSLMELVQEGNVGLAEAIRRYDPYRGVKFTSYAQYWIRAMILNYLMNVMQLVKVGNTRSGRKLFYNLSKAREELIRQGHLTPTTRQLADHLGVKEKEVIQVSRILDAPALSLDAPAPGTENTSLSSVIADQDAITPEAEIETLELRGKIRLAMNEFRASLNDDREIDIWERRVTAGDPMSLQDLGDHWSVSRERIRQVEKGITERFKKFWILNIGEEEHAIVFED